VESTVSENPVRPVAAIGLTATFPVIIDGGTVETPVLARIAKFAAVRRLTAAGPTAETLPSAVKNEMMNVLEIMVTRGMKSLES
jgi:hypothetical protein